MVQSALFQLPYLRVRVLNYMNVFRDMAYDRHRSCQYQEIFIFVGLCVLLFTVLMYYACDSTLPLRIFI